MNWKGKITALLHLARYREYLWFVIITTLLGVSAAGGTFGWKLVLVLLANWLSVAFAFMINDVEDAPDDALNPDKRLRNPVSARRLSPQLATIASWIVAILAVLLYMPLGLYPIITGVSCLAISFLYSWRKVRLKSIPVLDMLSHGMMLAGLQFLAGYFTFETAPVSRGLFPFLFLTAISIYGVLFNQLRDLKWDKAAGLNHTSCMIGQRPAYILMMSFFAIGVGAGFVTFFIIRLLPYWVLALVASLAIVFTIRPFRKARQTRTSIELQLSFQKPLEIAGACALLVQFIGPWIVAQFRIF